MIRKLFLNNNRKNSIYLSKYIDRSNNYSSNNIRYKSSFIQTSSASSASSSSCTSLFSNKFNIIISQNVKNKNIISQKNVRCFNTNVVQNKTTPQKEAAVKLKDGGRNFEPKNEFTFHWHFWNFLMSMTPAVFLWYYLHVVVKNDMKETALKMKNKNKNKNNVEKINGGRYYRLFIYIYTYTYTYR